MKYINMSRVGKKTIYIPANVEFSIKEDGEIIVKGPKGELKMMLNPLVKVGQKDEDGQKVLDLTVENPENKAEKAIWGTMRSNIANMVIGVTESFSKSLEVNGVGYRVELQGSKLELNVGYSHSVYFELPSDVSATVEKNVITLTSIDKQAVGEAAANIRKIRKPEPYKGKGIKYTDEVIRRKAGKAAKAAA